MSLLSFILTKHEAEKQLFRDNSAEIQAINRKLLQVVVCIGMGLFGCLFFLSFKVATYSPLRMLYFTATIILSVIGLILIRVRVLSQTHWWLYGVYGMALVYAIFSSAFLMPDYVCVIILAFLMQVPIIILDISLRINVLELVFSFIYLIIVIPRKDATLVTDEIINVVVFALLAVTLGSYLRKTRLENIELKRLAMRRETSDFLTGLGNRRKFFEAIEQPSTTQNPKKIVALAMIDIDDFKLFNDTYGHIAGDECLRSIGACFKAFSKEHAVSIFRYGGEEFVAVFYEEPLQHSFQLCEALKSAVQKLQIPHTQTPLSVVTICVGVAQVEGDSAPYRNTLLRADNALYLAKTGQKNKVVEHQLQQANVL